MKKRNRKLKLLTILISTIFCCGCENKEPLYMHLNNPETEVTLEEYKYYIITKAIDDERNKEWFDVKPTKVIGKEKDDLMHLVNSFLSDRYNWHREINPEKFGNSNKIYTQRFINEMETCDLNKYIPYIVNEYKLTSIINYASIMPCDYVQKENVNNQNRYRLYIDINLNVKASSENKYFENDLYIEGSNSVSFWVFIKEEKTELKIDGWYEMIHGAQKNFIIPYWSKNYAKDDTI